MTVGNMSQYALRTNLQHHEERGPVDPISKAAPNARLLFIAGILALLCAAFLLVAPNVGARVAVVGALLAGFLSAILVERARK